MRRRPEIRVNNWLVLHEAVRVGAGLAVLPCYLADHGSALRRIGGVLPEVFADQWLLVHRDLRALPRVRAVMDAVVELFQRQRHVLEGHGRSELRYRCDPNKSGETHMNGFRRMLGRAGIGLCCAARRGRRSRCRWRKPEEVGLSSAQLKKIEEVTAKNIDEGSSPAR